MGSEVDEILAFLGQHADQQFCSACLAFEFKLSFEGVDIALAAAGHQVALRESRAQCAICGRRALVTGLESNHDRSPAERVLLFLLDHRGRIFCHVCIARRLELNIGTVQKAVRDMRRTSDVRVADARCSQCEHERLVVSHGGDGVSRR